MGSSLEVVKSVLEGIAYFILLVEYIAFSRGDIEFQKVVVNMLLMLGVILIMQ